MEIPGQFSAEIDSRSPVEVSNPGAPIHFSGLPLFHPNDIAILAMAAERSMSPDAECWAIARSLDRAFLQAHAAAVTNRGLPPPAELRDAFDAVARAGEAFLLALGVEDATKTVVSDRELIARKAGVLTALIYHGRNEWRILPYDVVNSLAPLGSATPTECRRLAGDRLLVESARAVAYATMVAANAKLALSRKHRRRGPSKDVFSPILLDELVECYRLMFGQLPVVIRKSTYEGDLRRVGLAQSWLDAVLRVARDRLSQSLATGGTGLAEQRAIRRHELANRPDHLAEPKQLREGIANLEGERAMEAGRANDEKDKPIIRIVGFPLGAIDANKELVHSVSSLADNEVETLGRKLEAAIRRVKSRDASQALNQQTSAHGRSSRSKATSANR